MYVVGRDQGVFTAVYGDAFVKGIHGGHVAIPLGNSQKVPAVLDWNGNNALHFDVGAGRIIFVFQNGHCHIVLGIENLPFVAVAGTKGFGLIIGLDLGICLVQVLFVHGIR